MSCNVLPKLKNTFHVHMNVEYSKQKYFRFEKKTYIFERKERVLYVLQNEKRTVSATQQENYLFSSPKNKNCAFHTLKIKKKVLKKLFF